MDDRTNSELTWIQLNFTKSGFCRKNFSNTRKIERGSVHFCTPRQSKHFFDFLLLELTFLENFTNSMSELTFCKIE